MTKGAQIAASMIREGVNPHSAYAAAVQMTGEKYEAIRRQVEKRKGKHE
jgi:hypothetical protein